MSRKRWNGFAVAGFVLSFTNCLLGLIFSCIGVGSADKYYEKGKGLAIAGIVISIINIVVTTIAICILTVTLVALAAELPNMMPSDLVNRTQETILETYAKDQYEDMYSRENLKTIKKNAEKGYTYTLEAMEKDNSGIQELYRNCSKESKVVIYPSKPYGKTDYTIKMDLDCNNRK